MHTYCLYIQTLQSHSTQCSANIALINRVKPMLMFRYIALWPGSHIIVSSGLGEQWKTGESLSAGRSAACLSGTAILLLSLIILLLFSLLSYVHHCVPCASGVRFTVTENIVSKVSACKIHLPDLKCECVWILFFTDWSKIQNFSTSSPLHRPHVEEN